MVGADFFLSAGPLSNVLRKFDIAQCEVDPTAPSVGFKRRDPSVRINNVKVPCYYSILHVPSPGVCVLVEP